MSASEVLSYLTNEKLGSGKWGGSTEGFILNWQDHLRKYEKLRPKDTLSDEMKRHLLENAVEDIDDLHAIKVTARINKSGGANTAITYSSYCSLLLAAAQAHDKKYKLKPYKPRRQVYYHEHDTFDEYEVPGTFDIDTPVSMIKAKVAPHHGYRSSPRAAPRVGNRMPIECWKALSPEAKATWDTLDERSKGIILGITHPPPRQVNLSEVTGLLRAMMHETEAGNGDAQGNDADEPHFFDTAQEQDNIEDDDEPTMMLINAVKQGKALPPADLRRLMSTSSKREPESVTKKSSYQASVHITYRVSNHARKGNQGALMCRRN